MPAHPTRRGLLALLTAFFLFAATAFPAVAANPYRLDDGSSEGDPGDGVLNPSVHSGTELVPVYTTVGTTTWRLPVFVLPQGLAGVPVLIVFSPAGWHFGAAPVAAAEPPSSGGRWDRAR